MIIKKILFLLILFYSAEIYCQDDTGFQIARLKYDGGGDWYNDPSSEVNLLNFIQTHTDIKTKAEYKFVDIASDEIFSYHFLFLTGHGNIVFSNEEAKRLRTYLENGGFIYIDDDYGLDKAIRREMKKVFPDKDFLELPYSNMLFNIFYKFDSGTPKIHEHDKKPAQSFGIFIGQRLAVLYTYETNPSDGWADPEVHNDSKEKRKEALEFGTNIVIYVLSK